MSTKTALRLLAVAVFVVLVLLLWLRGQQGGTAARNLQPEIGDAANPPVDLRTDSLAQAREPAPPQRFEPPLPDAGSDAGELLGVITVISQDYLPESGAQVWLWGSSTSMTVGTTDAAGVAKVKWPPSESLVLHAEKPGSSHESIELVSPFPRAVTVVLARGGTLRGTVRHASGSPVGAGVRVLAIPAHNKCPSKLFFASACQVAEGSPGATTDSRGAFLIDGLRFGENYSLLASGPGMMTSGLPGPFAAGDDTEHAITVLSAYALRIDLIDSRTKNPVRVSPCFLFGVGLGIKLGGTELRVANVTPAALRYLAGCGTSDDREPHRIDDYFLSEVAAPEAGPVRLRIEWPGYQPWSGALNARSLALSTERQSIELRPLAASFGRLVLKLPRSMRHRPAQAGLFAGTLTVAPLHHDPMDFFVDPSASGVVELDGIPQGLCTCTLAGFPEGAMYPPPGSKQLEVEISSTPATLEIPDDAIGSITLDPRRPDGSAHAGYLEVVLMRGTVPGDDLRGFRAPGSPRRFTGPPYRIDLLMPGEYTVVPVQPSGLERLVRCVVIGDGEATCTIHVP